MRAMLVVILPRTNPHWVDVRPGDRLGGKCRRGEVAGFLGPLATTYPDPGHSLDERREITLGYTMKKDLTFVSHCERGERIRIVGARPATRAERRQHEEGTGSETR